MSHLKLGVKQSVIIRDFLKNSISIKSLNLYANKFGIEGARNLAEGLKVNSVLEQLDLGCNRIRNKGAVAIADAVLG